MYTVITNIDTHSCNAAHCIALATITLRFGYVWAVHSLYYWWRDQGRAEQSLADTRWGACYLNRMDPVEVAFGWGKHSFQSVRVALSAAWPFHRDLLTNCLAPPVSEYQFPRDLHRYSLSSHSLLTQ